MALEATIFALGGLGPDNLVVSHDQEASNDLLAYVKGWARWFARMGYPGASAVRDVAREVRFGNGMRVVAIPGGRPAAIRHYGGNIWLDEAAHHARLKENLGAAGPAISQANGKLRVISTVFSDGDAFWAIMDGQRTGWTKHSTTIHDAIAQGHRARDGTPINIDELRLDVPDPDIFSAEFENIPLSDATSYFPHDLLDRCEQVIPPTGGSLYGGFDVARSARGDLAAMCEVRRDKEHYGASPTLYAERGQDYEAMQDVAARFHRERGWVRMAVDAQGLGNETAERLQRRLGGPAVVDAVSMNPQSKSDMMTTLRSLMDQGHMALPLDRELRMDLHSIRRIIGDSSIRYDADRNERGHADRAWALALAVRAAGHQPAVTQRQIQVRTRRRPRGPMY